MKPYLALKGIKRSFNGQKVLKGIDLEFPRHGLFAIVGPSGSGKSTLLNIIAGLDQGYEGSYRVFGKEMAALTSDELSAIRLSEFGYVFQNFNLLELESALHNVILPIDALSTAKKKLQRRRGRDLLSYVGLEEKAPQQVNTLSGGEKQRVAIARALANDPSIILADEPSGALDERNAAMVFDLLRKIAQKKLVIVVSHDQEAMEQYADTVISMKDGRISLATYEGRETSLPSPESLSMGVAKRSSSLSTPFLLSHASKILKAKGFRSTSAISAISIGLIGLGLSIYVSNSIEAELSGAFSSLLPEKSIVMSPLNPTANVISSSYSAPEDEVKEIKELYEGEVKDYGVTYLADWENIFSDRNDVYFYRNQTKVDAPSFSIRTAAEYYWLDDHEDEDFFPAMPKSMANDEIVIGLPYDIMFNICYGLRIIRSYESLGDYIQNHGLSFIFDLAHYDWGYEDEQILSVVAVMPYDETAIFHSNHLWSRYLFEESMRFPSLDSPNIPEEAPWTLNQVYYLEATGDLTSLLVSLRQDKSLSSFLFERWSFDEEDDGYASLLPRAYVYMCDKNSVPYADLEYISDNYEGFSSRLITTSGSYTAASSSLLSGFAQKFFISPYEADLDMVIDSYSDIPEEEVNLDYELPIGVYDGNYLKALTGGFRLSSNLSALKEGREPIGIEECCLSSALMEEYGEIEEIVLAAQISESLSGKRIHREFKKGRLKVVGVVEDDSPVLYVDGDWTIDYFRDALGMSSYYLEPTGAIFSVKEGYDPNELLSSLSKEMPEYRFENPSESLMSSLTSTMDYVGAILSSFSLVALVISSLLFLIVMMISLQENMGEARLLYVLGISRKDIARAFFYQSLCYGGGAFVISLGSIITLEVVIHGYIASAFDSSMGFAISWIPLIAMAGFVIIILLFFYIGLRIYARKKVFFT